MYERLKKSIVIIGSKPLKSTINLFHPIPCGKCEEELYLARTGEGTKKVSKVGENWEVHKYICAKL